MMKVFLAAIGVVFMVHPVAAEVTHNGDFTFINEVVAHGGGCRKSSPKGQCCHAGKEKAHCHKKDVPEKTSKSTVKK